MSTANLTGDMFINKDTEMSDSQSEPNAAAQPASQSSFWLSTALFISATILLATSTFFPYWQMRLNAPQYPNGLFVTVYVSNMEGDVREIDGLNHYIGMKPLEEAASIERRLAPIAMVVIGLMILGVALIHSKWYALLAIPAMLFPIVFLADMWAWLWYYGNNLDPTAALSSSIKPFTPTILGTGNVGQFSTTATLQIGWYLALLAAIMTGVGLHYRRTTRQARERSALQETAA